MNDRTPGDASAPDAVGELVRLVPPEYRALPLVGIGGSAGGIPAIEALLRTVPADSGLAFAVVLHLSPDHPSLLAEVLQHASKLPLLQVTRPVAVQPNHVYVIPPRHLLYADGDCLVLRPMETPHGPHHVAVDLFFRSLAETYGPNAVAIVLSGGDGDGATGIQRVKEHGGLTIAQDPHEAEVGSMPRAAIATGRVDWVLPVAAMADRILAYRRVAEGLKLAPLEAPERVTGSAAAVAGDEKTLREILACVRARTGRDFTHYKRATVVRRVARRMQVHTVSELADYLICVQSNEAEAGLLLQDLLISVTNFFRDGASFAALQALVPTFFEGKGPDDRVRVWVAACASGEEAYSVAMLLHEHASTLAEPPLLQVFATDLDEQAIRIARAGAYPHAIEADVSRERLDRFFAKSRLGYRVSPQLRETVLFTPHDLLKDAPFSRLDMVTCRNLMIYLAPPAQERLLSTFFFALRSKGLLFLGSAESVDDASRLFEPVDRQHRIHRKHSLERRDAPLFDLAPPVVFGARAGYAAQRGVVRDPVTERLELQGASSETGALPGGHFHYRLLEMLAPPSLVIDHNHELVHLSESAGRFLKVGGGTPTTDLLRLVPASLRVGLRAALAQALATGAAAAAPPLEVDLGGGPITVMIRAVPVREGTLDYFLVTFDSRGADTGDREARPMPNPIDPLAQQLDNEIERLKARLRETVEQYEASNEELKASNEELQSMNEELRSATEQLETGREELQSINEEISTVNLELKAKVEELGSSNSDMLNLMDATSIPTIFLDRELCITRYTPTAGEVFNFIATDIGRPLTDLSTKLNYPDLMGDAERVLARLAPIEREVDCDQHWYATRMLPYRTADYRIAGVVLTLVDITERRQTVAKLEASEERMRLIVENAHEYAIFATDLERNVTTWNPGAERLLRYAEPEVLGRTADVIFTPEDIAAGVPEAEARTALETGRAADDRFHLRKDGSRFWASGVMMSMQRADGAAVGFVKILRDQTAARQTQETLERSRTELLQAWQETEAARREAELQRQHLESLFMQAPAPICILRGADYRIEFANPHMCQLWGLRQEDLIGRPMFDAVSVARRTVVKEMLDGILQSGVARVGKEVAGRIDRRGHGEPEEVHLNFTYAPLRDVAGRIDGVLVMASDVTDEVRAREQMSELHEMEQTASRAKDDFLAMLGHELRNPLAPLRTSLYLIRQHMPPSTADPLLDIVERQAANLTRIVDDLLDAARVTEGKIGLRLETVDIVQATQHALDAAREFLDSQGHQVQVHLPKRALRLRADPVRLEQIVLNLLNNAGKYTPAGGRIVITVKRVGRMAELHVADNGIGIPDDLRPRLFQIFQQGNRDLSREEGGLGIGLSVVRRLVELHGGSVQAMSEGVDRGSEFIVRLPLLMEAVEAREPPGPHPAELPFDEPRRILVVDDNRDAGETLSMLAQSLGHETQLAEDGLSALRICAEWRPDLVFLDLGLPGMDGYEVAREIRLRNPTHVPRLIAVTGYGQERDRAKTREAGFDEHLVKPADFGQIVTLLQELPPAGARGSAGSPPAADGS